MSADVPVLVITGTMGSGKTTMLGEASDLLADRGIPHVAIDLDTLGIGHLPDTSWADLPYRNLASVWQNYAAAGGKRLLVAEAVENVCELNRIRDAIPNRQVIVCRLRAALGRMQSRVSQREPGMCRDAFIARVAELDAILDAASIEHFSVTTDTGRSITEVAVEMLSLAQWIWRGEDGQPTVRALRQFLHGNGEPLQIARDHDDRDGQLACD